MCADWLKIVISAPLLYFSFIYTPVSTTMMLVCISAPHIVDAVTLQEYLPRIKDNDVLRAVEKNVSGSRPKELFEEVLEDVDKLYETDR